MTVTVQLFAAARDLAGSTAVAVELTAGASVADLRTSLARAYPALAGLLARSRIAVDCEFADDGTVILPGVELAVIPPVSGG